jgi:hypothetical protein
VAKPPQPKVVEPNKVLQPRTLVSIEYVQGARAANHMVTDQNENIRLTHASFMQMVNRVGFSLSTYNSPDLTQEPEKGIKKGQGITLPANAQRKREFIVGKIIEDAKAQPLILTVDVYDNQDIVLKGSRRPKKEKQPKEKKAKKAKKAKAAEEAPAEEAEEPAEPADEEPVQ